MSVKLEIIRELVRSRKDELPADVNDWPADWREEYEERAAILDKEFYGSLSRSEAEQWAETCVRAFYRIHHSSKGENDA